ncbi:unnamed protein product [Brassica oleracea]
MATSKISLSELKPGSCSRTVVLRFSVFGSYKCEERHLMPATSSLSDIISEICETMKTYDDQSHTTQCVMTSRFGCIVASDAAMSKVTNVRAVEAPHPMGQGEEQDPRNPSKKSWT